MKFLSRVKYRAVLPGAILLLCLNCAQVGENQPEAPAEQVRFGPAQVSGFLEDDRLVECSGMDFSSRVETMLWAINDGGHGPYIYALGMDGRSLGRVKISGAQNRDWEGLDTFIWNGRPMILIADFGDNAQQHETHTLYVIEEPLPEGGRFNEPATAPLAWRIVFSYPDQPHDAEGVAVDATDEKVLVLTKRDDPPLLFELPLTATNQPILAYPIAALRRIPAPSAEDLQRKYGEYRSQPTALDLSPDGCLAVVLTYKHAYLFHRPGDFSWASALSAHPDLVPLPLPEHRRNLRQRESICFSPDSQGLWVTSEGRGAGLYRLRMR